MKNIMVLGDLGEPIKNALSRRFNIYEPVNYITRTSKGRKRTVTAAQQRRAKIKRKNRR